MDKNYVIVCNSQTDLLKGGLVFLTENNKCNEYGYVTVDVTKARKLTYQEAFDKMLPIYGFGVSKNNYCFKEYFAIEIDKLEELGFKQTTVYIK